MTAFARGLYAVARGCYQRVLDLAPDRTDAVWGVAECHASLDEVDLAITWYRRYLDLRASMSPRRSTCWRKLGDRPSPGRASDGYVTAYFDRFAEDFDQNSSSMSSITRCRDCLYDSVAPFYSTTWRCSSMILDLGCGTGLSGCLFRRHANRLDGVDLSPVMLDHARRKRRIRIPLTAGLKFQPILWTSPISMMCCIAGDVLAYFGRLSGLFRGIRPRLLKCWKAALFAFSVEAPAPIRTYDSG